MKLAVIQYSVVRTSCSRLGVRELSGSHYPINLQHLDAPRKDVVEVELWEELESMPEGEARVMTRQFLYVDGIEIEVCTNENGKYFVRHNVYWWIEYGQKNPDPEQYNIIRRSIKSMCVVTA